MTTKSNLVELEALSLGFTPEAASTLARLEERLTLDIAQRIQAHAAERVRCATCGREITISVATALARGWPMCHGATMELMR